MFLKKLLKNCSKIKLSYMNFSSPITNLPFLLIKTCKKEYSEDNKIYIDKNDLPIYREYQKIVREIKKSEKGEYNFEGKSALFRKFIQKLRTLKKYKECLDFNILEEYFLSNFEKFNNDDFIDILHCFGENNYVGKDKLIWLKSADEICRRDLEFERIYPVLDLLTKLEEFKKDKKRNEKVIQKLDTYNLQDESSIILLFTFLIRGNINIECNLWRKYVPFLKENLKFDLNIEERMNFFKTVGICSMYALMNGVTEFDEIVENIVKKTLLLNLKIFEINTLVDFIYTLSIFGKIKGRDFIKFLILSSSKTKQMNSIMLTKLKVLILYFCYKDREFNLFFLNQSKIGIFKYPDENYFTEFKEDYQKYKDCDYSTLYQFFSNYVVMHEDSLISTMLDASNLKL
jgi:hypothetical protein